MLLQLLLLLLLANDVTQLLNACADVLKTRRSSSETFLHIFISSKLLAPENNKKSIKENKPMSLM